jgi:hypothetical protein
MPVAHTNPETGATEYSEGVGNGTLINPYKGRSIIHNGQLVDATNPLSTVNADLAGRIGATNDGVATSDEGTFSLIALTKRALQRLTLLVTSLGGSGDAAATSDTGNHNLVGLIKRALTHLSSLITGVGAQADAAAASDTGSHSLIALVKRGLTSLSTIAARLPVGGVSTESTQATVSANIGSALDGEATGNGSVIALLKRIRTLLGGFINVRGRSRIWANLTPALTAGGAGYAQFTSLGGLIELTSAIPEAGRSVFIHSVQVTCRQSPGFVRLWIFRDNPVNSAVGNGQVVNIVPADNDKVAGFIDIDGGAFADSTTHSANQASNAPLPKAFAPVGTSLWVLPQQRTASSVVFDGAADMLITIIGVDE